MLDGLAEVPEDDRHRADHVVGVDELVAVLQRLRDRDPPLVRRVRVAVLPERPVRVPDGVEAKRDLAQETELLRDAERFLRGREGDLPVTVRRARELAGRERTRRQQPDTLGRWLVADELEAARDQPFEIGMLRVPPGDELRHVRVHGRDLEDVAVRPRLEEDPRALVRRERGVALAVIAPDAAD